MLQVSNLSKTYGARVLFDEVSFSLNPRERIALIGRNGHGKSTLLKVLLGTEEFDSGAVSKPQDYQIGYLAQHFSLTHGTIIDEVCSILPPERKEERYQAERLLMGLGFEESHFGQSPTAFSGGFQLRIELAKVLLGEPNLLLLDEPTNYLDIVTVRWLAKELRSWKGEIVLISHDRSFLETVCTHTMGIHRGKVRKVEGGPHKYRQLLVEEEEVYHRTRANVLKRKEELTAFITRFRAQASKASLVQSRVKELEKLEAEGWDELSHIEQLAFRFREAGGEHKTLLTCQSLSFRYPEQEELLLKDLSLIIKRGDRIGVIGKNGRGKSTLLKLCGGELAPVGGEINAHELTRVGVFGQTNIDRLEPDRTIEEEIEEVNNILSRTEVRRICGTMMFAQGEAEKKIKFLSGGERSRVLLGKILAKPANVLLLDEPTSHLDMESVDALTHALIKFDGAVMLVSHEERILRELCNRFIIFEKKGPRVYEGSYDEFLQDVGWEEEQGIAKEQKKEVPKEQDRELQKQRKLLEKKKIVIEHKIARTEQEKSDIEEKLLHASEARDTPQVISLHEKLAVLDRQLDEFLEELISLE